MKLVTNVKKVIAILLKDVFTLKPLVTITTSVLKTLVILTKDVSLPQSLMFVKTKVSAGLLNVFQKLENANIPATNLILSVLTNQNVKIMLIALKFQSKNVNKLFVTKV